MPIEKYLILVSVMEKVVPTNFQHALFSNQQPGNTGCRWEVVDQNFLLWNICKYHAQPSKWGGLRRKRQKQKSVFVCAGICWLRWLGLS